jgi:hypothetical protein
MAVINLKKIQPIVWIPPSDSAVFKLTVEDSDGIEDDITDFVKSFEIIDGVTEGIGTFAFTVVNGDGYFNDKWSGMEIVRFYCDYAATATTLRFRGRLELPSFKNHMVECQGRSEALFLMDKTVTEQYEDVDTAVIIADLIDKYGDSRYTKTNIDALSGTTITINWYQKDFWDCVQDLCEAAVYDCYVDANLDVHYFASESRTNENEAIVHDKNLIEVGDFVQDNQQIRNKIIVYGAVIEDSQIIYTAKDDTSITRIGIKEDIVSDSNVTNKTQAQELADYLLSIKKDPPQLGDVVSFMLATIQPGEMIPISAPDDNIEPLAYKCVRYSHVYDESSFQTTVTINKEPKKISQIVKKQIQQDNAFQDTNSNPYGMEYSYNTVFSTATGVLTNTEISSDSLHLATGQSSGEWISDTETVSSNVTEIYLSAAGDILTGATFYVSVDGGTSYQSYSLKEKKTLTQPNTALKVKIEINNTSTHIKSVSVLYKRV